MTRKKTAIEQCIDAADGELCVPSVRVQAAKVHRSLMRLAKLTAFAQGNLDREVDWDAHNAKVDREVVRLRRLGVLS